MTSRTKRVPEHVATHIRKVEPVGDLVRLVVTRDGAWEDQVTILMPCASLPDIGFATTSAREISEELAAPATTAH
jgi:hypothetical protein